MGVSSYTKYLNYKAFKLHKSLTGGLRENVSELCRRPKVGGPNSRNFLVKSNFDRQYETDTSCDLGAELTTSKLGANKSHS